jgi:hypothetical protein
VGVISVQGRVDYQARSQSPEGNSSESGEAVATVFRFGPSLDGSQEPVESIYEDFYAANAPDPVPDRPGQGCGDPNHGHSERDDCRRPPPR